MPIRYLLTFLFLSVLLSGCDIADNTVATTNTFVKIYDDSRFEEEYYPVDVIQTNDNGYLILSEKKNDQALFTSVFVLKVNENGEVISSVDLPDPTALPVKGWSKINDQYYFVCMNANTLGAQLIAVDDAGAVADPISIGGLTYPLATKVDGQNIIVLSYDNQNTESEISIVTTDGQVTQTASYTIGAGVDVEKPIIDHITRNGRQLPFDVGNAGNGTYYFNGFYNYTFSLVFTNFGTNPQGISQGQLSAGGISAIASLGGSSFSISRFNFDSNFLNPLTTIPTTAVTSSTDLGGNTFPEIELNTRIGILQDTELNLIFGTNTQAKKLVLYGFDATGEALGTRYIGTDNPYTFAAFSATSDGGIAILAQTALEGRFPRIALFKRDAAFFNSLTSK